MTRRKSLARRWPHVVYRVEQDGEDVLLKGWEANEYGRMIKSRYLGYAAIREWDHEPVRATWLTSDDTDGIHSLHEEVRDALWQLDDAIREAYKSEAFDWEPTRDTR